MSSAPSLDRDGDPLPLRDVRESDTFPRYLAGMWQRRGYATYVAKSELRGRQMDSFLGNLWHLINPILNITVFYVIFGLVLDTTRGVENFIGYLAVGVFTYSLTQKSILQAGRSLLTNRGLIQIVSFPRALLPLTVALTETLAMVPAYLVMLGVATATGESPKLTWLLIVPSLALQVVFNIGMGLVAARAINRIPDVQNVLPFVFRLGFYGSGVMFDATSYVEKGGPRLAFELNPAYCFLEMNRAFILDGRYLEPRLVVIATVWTVAALVFGLLWFRAAEDTYGAS